MIRSPIRVNSRLSKLVIRLRGLPNFVGASYRSSNRCVIPISTQCVPCIRKEPPPLTSTGRWGRICCDEGLGIFAQCVDYLIAIVDGGRAGPIWGVRTGFAIPKKTVTPCPPQRVESASLAFL